MSNIPSMNAATQAPAAELRSDNPTRQGAIQMQDLTMDQAEAVGGGFLPLLVGAALLLTGCAHCTPYQRKDPPPGSN
jgi:hypothetical protein